VPRPVRPLLLVCGFVALLVGAVGIVVPLLPTTPFVLLAAACFLRSSPRVHRLLLAHPVLGSPLRDFLGGRGLPRRTKAVAVALLWTSVLASALLVVRGVAPRALLVGVAAAVTLYLLRLPSAAETSPAPQDPA